MWEEKQDEWFEAMKEEQLRPSCKTVVMARKKAEQVKAKKEFLEEYLPILMICTMNICFAIGVGIVLMQFAAGLGQKSLFMGIMLAVGYLPLLAYSIATLCMKCYKNKKEESKCQQQ